MTDDDHRAAKASVQADWTGRAGAWDRWADDLAEVAERFNAPLLEAAGVGAGQEVLDLASGAGEPALEIARRVGPGGRVVATDMVEEMLAGARRRAAAEGLDNLEFEIADMEDLPFAEASFDRVTCRFGIMFCPQPEVALAEARRVLRPGGRAAYLIWGPMEDTTMFSVLWSAVEETVGSAAESFTYPPFRLGEPGTLARLMTAAGFTAVEESELRFDAEIPAERPFWRAQLEMAFAPRLKELNPAQRQALDAAVVRGFEAHRAGEAIRLKAHVRLTHGDKPA